MKLSRDQHIMGELLAPEVAELLDTGQAAAVRTLLDDLLAPQIVELLMALKPQHRVAAFLLVPKDRAPEVFSYLEQEEREELVESLSGEQAAAIINEMDPDDRTAFFEDVPEEVAARLLALLHPEERAETQRILEYPEESIGRIMTPEFVTVRPEWTVRQALEHIRSVGKEAETFYTVYVVDDAGRLINHVSLRRLILARPEDQVSRCLLDNIQTVRLKATADREEAVRAMEQYDLPILPVVDEQDVLVGIVTFDDVADVAEQEVTEDIHKLGGMQALTQPYLATGILELVGKRVGWLAILFGAGLLTVMAMGRFEEQIGLLPILALFVPLIIATGGNSGFQAATVMTRSIALQEVQQRHWLRVFGRELVGGLVLGALLAVLGFVIATGVGLWMFHQEAEVVSRALAVGVAVALSVASVVVFGNMIGSMLPFLLQRLGFDPATSSTPFVATIVDVVGLLLYFTIATTILGHLMVESV